MQMYSKNTNENKLLEQPRNTAKYSAYLLLSQSDLYSKYLTRFSRSVLANDGAIGWVNEVKI